MEALIGFSLVLLIALLGPALYEIFRYQHLVIPEIKAREKVLDEQLYCGCDEKDWECDENRLRCKKCGKWPGNE